MLQMHPQIDIVARVFAQIGQDRVADDRRNVAAQSERGCLHVGGRRGNVFRGGGRSFDQAGNADQ